MNLLRSSTGTRASDLQIPIIDVSAIEGSDERAKIVNEVRIASEEWGFFKW